MKGEAAAFFPLLIMSAVFSLLIGCGNEGDPFGVNIEPTLSIETINPPDGSVGISIHTMISLSFPTDIDSRTINTGNIILLDGSGRAVQVVIAYLGGNRIATVRPRLPLSGNTLFKLVTQGIRASDGTLFQSQTFTFTTGSDDPGGAPEITAFTPLPGQEQVNIDSTVTISFSKAMNKQSVEQAFSISGGVVGAFTWSVDAKTVTFTPAVHLTYDTTYFATILNTCTDTAGTPLKSGQSWYFKTRVQSWLEVEETVPADGATTAPPNTNIRYVFNQAVSRSTITTNFVVDPAMVFSISDFTFEQNDQVVIFDPPSDISAGTIVRATWAAGLLSVNGDALRDAPYTIQFTIESNPPVVTHTQPENGATGVEATQVIRFEFSESIDTSTVPGNFTVDQGGAVAGTLSYEDDDKTIVFTPSSNWNNSPAVTVTAGAAIADLGGTNMGSDYTIVFNIDTTVPAISSGNPADGDTDVSCDTPATHSGWKVIYVNFSEELQPSASTFSSSPAMTGTTSWQNSNRTMVFTSDHPLDGSVHYTLTVTMTDLAGNTGTGTIAFDTDDDPPNVSTNSPAGGATGVALDSDIIVTFSERMRKNDVEAAFSYTNNNTSVVFDTSNGIVSWDTPSTDDFGTVFSFNPSNDFAASTPYTITVTSSAADVGGNNMTGNWSSNFQTAP